MFDIYRIYMIFTLNNLQICQYQTSSNLIHTTLKNMHNILVCIYILQCSTNIIIQDYTILKKS